MLFCYLVLIVRDKITDASKCFGFVTFENPVDADDAVKGMDAQVIHYFH